MKLLLPLLLLMFISVGFAQSSVTITPPEWVYSDPSLTAYVLLSGGCTVLGPAQGCVNPAQFVWVVAITDQAVTVTITFSKPDGSTGSLTDVPFGDSVLFELPPGAVLTGTTISVSG
jgi:hypothetical protein